MVEKDSNSESITAGESEDKEHNQRQPENQTSRLKRVPSIIKQAIGRSRLHITAALLLSAFVIWSGLPDATPQVTSWDVANDAFRAYLQYLLLWTSGLLVVISYLMGLAPRHFLEESDRRVKNHRHEEDFLLGRSDNLDKVLSYLRSGVSILTAVFAAVIAWFLDLSNERNPAFIESTLIIACSALVVFGVISLLASFGNTTVVAKEWTLDDSLLRTGQPDDVFIAQLTEIVRMKAAMIDRIKDIIGSGLTFFIFITGAGIFLQSYNAVQSFIEYPAVWVIGMMSYGVSLLLLVAFAFAAVSFLGIDTYVDITSSLENENAAEGI